VIDIRGDEDWQRLCGVFGRPELAVDARYASAADRLARRAEIEELVVRWTTAHEPRKVMGLLQEAGVPAGAMQRVGDYAEDPQLLARGTYREMSQPGVNEHLPTEARPARFEHVADPPVAPAPYPGEHTREVCAEWLGMPPARIEELLAAGVIEEAARPPVSGPRWG
jgi:crotonobetainyl-CoA:carnitine CoA-transferase CaiB-like acyl-CoA transferase